MDKGGPPRLFVNDGSFMERFKQLQGDKEKDPVNDKAIPEKDSNPKPVFPSKTVIGRTGFQLKSNSKIGTPASSSGGKLAFSLKQKSKLVAPPVKLGEDDEDDDGTDAGNVSGNGSYAKRQKLGLPDALQNKSQQAGVAPPSPSDPTVKNVADRLANFVAKNGQQFENVTRQNNPGDTPFKFLFDKTCSDYKYYEYQLAEEEKALSQTWESQNSSSGTVNTSASKSTGNSQLSWQPQPNYQTPTSALYEAADETGAAATASAGQFSAPSAADSLAMMEFYMKKAAQEERKKPFKQSKDEMPPPPSLQASSKRGHHMGDYIPQEELEKFMAACNDAAAQKCLVETAEKAKIQADNVGHKILSKMGWREGEGLGSSRSGIADPIMASNVKQDHLGVGAQQPGEVSSEDDIYEQYKKRMMLGYRYRPNPLNNPRKAYY